MPSDDNCCSKVRSRSGATAACLSVGRCWATTVSAQHPALGAWRADSLWLVFCSCRSPTPVTTSPPSVSQAYSLCAQPSGSLTRPRQATHGPMRSAAAQRWGGAVQMQQRITADTAAAAASGSHTCLVAHPVAAARLATSSIPLLKPCMPRCVCCCCCRVQAASCGDVHPVSAPGSRFSCPADSEFNPLAANISFPDETKCCKVSGLFSDKGRDSHQSCLAAHSAAAGAGARLGRRGPHSSSSCMPRGRVRRQPCWAELHWTTPYCIRILAFRLLCFLAVCVPAACSVPLVAT